MVVAFLLIFSFAAYTMLRDRIAVEKQEWSYTGFMRTERNLRNDMERRTFKNAPKKETNAPKAAKKSEKKSGTANKSRRFKSPPSELGKLCIGTLFDKSTSPSKDILYKTTANLIKNLYDNAPFYQEAKISNLEHSLLDAIIKKGSSLNKLESLADLYPDNPHLAQIYYKMLKGTTIFNVEKQTGYPALGDYLTLGDQESKIAVHFCFAPTPLLQALFGDKLAEAILAEEQLLKEKKHKISYLNKSELESLISKNHPQIDLAALDGLLDFVNKPLPLSYLRKTDKSTQVILKRNL